MGYLTWWSFPKKAWFIILGELGVIVSLSVSLYMTYLNDAYFQSYANGLSSLLVPVLSVVFGISSASVAAYLYVGIRRMQDERDTEHLATKKKTNHSIRETSEPHRDNASSNKNDSQPLLTKNRLRPIVPGTSQVRSKQHSKERETHGTIPEHSKES